MKTKYRMTGAAGTFDVTSANKDRLIKLVSHRKGFYTLWQWNGKQWEKVEAFIF